MENASKALIIAASVLTALVILTIAVVLNNNYRETAKNIEETQATSELSKYNYEFEKYIGRKDIKAHEIITVKNLIEENKKKGYKVQGFIRENNSEMDLTSKEAIGILKDNLRRKNYI